MPSFVPIINTIYALYHFYNFRITWMNESVNLRISFESSQMKLRREESHRQIEIPS